MGCVFLVCHSGMTMKNDTQNLNYLRGLCEALMLRTNVLVANTTGDEKSDILAEWRTGQLDVLISTFVDGIDSNFTTRVFALGGLWSLSLWAQLAGRTRLPMQRGKDSVVHVLHNNALSANHQKQNEPCSAY